MKRKEKEKLIQEIGMKFDEATALFSDDTLESMMMNEILGGVNENACVQNGCDDSIVNKKGCIQNGCKAGPTPTSTPTPPPPPPTPTPTPTPTPPAL